MKQCKHCNKNLANASSLTRHVIAKHPDKTTSPPREHACPHCNAKFPRNETLQRHIGSKHTQERMERCQFCLKNFRKDYFAQHESGCARKYWTTICRNADLTTNQNQGFQSNGVDGPSVQRDLSPDVQLVPATENSLCVVHEININTRLASKAFNIALDHCEEPGGVEWCLEALTASFCHGIPIEPHPRNISWFGQVNALFRLAESVGECIRGEVDISDEDEDGYTLLDLACQAGAASLLEPLFWRGAKFHSLSLFSAFRSGSFDTVHFCLALGADPNDFPLEYWDESALMRASASPETSHITSLLVEYGANVFVRDADEQTPLHTAAIRADVDLIRVLLAKDSSTEFVSAIDFSGNCALHYAVINTRYRGLPDRALECVSILLDAGADAETLDCNDESILCIAVRFGSEEMVQFLLSEELAIHWGTENLERALWGAVRFDQEATARILMEAGARIDNVIMLEDALRYSTVRAIELLIEAGAPLDLVKGETIKSLTNSAIGEPGEPAWEDAAAKCELLRKHHPDERIRSLLDGLSPSTLR